MRRPGRRTLAALAAGVALCAAPGTAAAYDELAPGGTSSLDERVPVNVVFVGFHPGEVPWSRVRAQLPATAEPVVRSRRFYGIDEPTGLRYRYAPEPFYTDQAWEDDFFAYLDSIAVEQPLSLFQELYNEQRRNALDVTDNAWIDAPTVEKRLIDEPPPGVDTREPTIFFINWYGRSDFRFHVYTKTGEPDPDTGYDFGLNRESRKMVAWGGSTPDDEESGLGARRGVHRVWFYDLSAGPEVWGGSYNVDDADLDGNGRADYRIPPYWEYGHYRGIGQLAGDLGKVVRYVGLDLLFTSSPLYPPYFTPDRLPSREDIDVNTAEGWSGVDASRELIEPGLFLRESRELPTGVPLTQDFQDLPFTGSLKDCYVGFIVDSPCFERYAGIYPPFANLFLWTALNQRAILDRRSPYEAAMVNFAVGDPELQPWLLGFADDNWIDGTQSGAFSFVSPGIVDAGYGLTTTMIHEHGHHAGMSHPHDGYDPETDTDFGPTGPWYFVWLGDESNSIMSYIDVNWDYSQFDRDNAARHHAAGFAHVANRIAGDIAASPRAAEAAGGLAAADRALVQAQAALSAHRYDRMVHHARTAYRRVRTTAAGIGVPVEQRQPGPFTVVEPDAERQRSRMAPATVDRGAREAAKRALP